AGDRIRYFAADAIGLEGRRRVFRGAPADLAGRVADHRGALGHFRQHHRSGADAGAVADPGRAQHLGDRADDDIVADRRMALLPALLPSRARAAEGYPVIERAIIADLGGLP